MLTDMFKTKNGLSSESMVEVFPLRNKHYSLRNDNEFLQPKVKMISYEMETILVRGMQLWQTLPAYIRNSNSMKDFKTKIRNWNPCKCQCRLCRP